MDRTRRDVAVRRLELWRCGLDGQVGLGGQAPAVGVIGRRGLVDWFPAEAGEHVDETRHHLVPGASTSVSVPSEPLKAICSQGRTNRSVARCRPAPRTGVELDPDRQPTARPISPVPAPVTTAGVPPAQAT